MLLQEINASLQLGKQQRDLLPKNKWPSHGALQVVVTYYYSIKDGDYTTTLKQGVCVLPALSDGSTRLWLESPSVSKLELNSKMSELE